MKILAITPGNNDTITPETGFVNLMRKAGHKVVLQYTDYGLSKIEISQEALDFKPDIIWGMMEYSLPTAIAYKKILNVPVLSHIECIPPWRIGIDNPKDYGFDYDDKFDELNKIENYRNIYSHMLEAFLESDYRTISEETWRYTFEKTIGYPCDASIRYYTYDYDQLKKHKGFYIRKNQIYTIARFTPIKRVHHVIRALAKIDKTIRPKFMLIGYGPQEPYLRKISTELDVEVEFCGNGKDGVKERIIQESIFGVQIFSGMTVVESAYFSTPVISYDTPQMVEVFKDSVTWAKMNDIDSLTEKIKDLLLDSSKRERLGKYAHDLILSGKTNIMTEEAYVNEIERTMDIALYRHRLYTNTDVIRHHIEVITKDTKLQSHHHRIINDVDFKGTVLDIGGGCGAFSILAKLTKPDIDIYSTDMNLIYTHVGKAMAEKSNASVQFFNDYLTRINFPENMFDTIVLSHVLEHIPDIYQVLIEIVRILKPNGKIFIATPYTNHHDSPEHLTYFSFDTEEINSIFNGKQKSVDFYKLISEFPFKGTIEIIEDGKPGRQGGWQAIYAKLQNEK